MSDRLSDYDYTLPPALIAQRPRPDRHGSRLLVLALDSGRFFDRSFADLPALLDPKDLIVVNDTRVLAARFLGRKAGGTLAAEILLAGPGGDGRWRALIRPGRRFKPGDVFAGEGGLAIRVEEEDGEGGRWLRLLAPASWEEAMASQGRIPLPPYIRRAADARDLRDYQTLFAREDGAVAAPTAGLHFSHALLDELARRGIEQRTLTLHVGPGSFQPVREEDPSRHRMHAERYRLPAATRRAAEAARARGGRVLAVGTTSARVLETPAEVEWNSEVDLAGETRLFIRPPHVFKRVDALLTNFHLPRSTLLMLVSAFAGRERVLAAYRHAVEAAYRFYSYGDAMLILPGGGA